MARSRKIKSHFRLVKGVDPKFGKEEASRSIRRRARQALQNQGEEFDFTDIQDKTRGKAGSKDPDYGWDNFADGRIVYHDETEPK